MVSWVVYIAIGLIIGGAAGFFLGRLDDFSQKEKQAMQDKLDQAQKEMANYKHEVTEHFVATAGLVNNLTESYQAVHEHLAKGAKSLCDHQTFAGSRTSCRFGSSPRRHAARLAQ